MTYPVYLIKPYCTVDLIRLFCPVRLINLTHACLLIKLFCEIQLEVVRSFDIHKAALPTSSNKDFLCLSKNKAGLSL
jgi:hypothetical protein